MEYAYLRPQRPPPPVLRLSADEALHHDVAGLNNVCCDPGPTSSAARQRLLSVLQAVNRGRAGAVWCQDR